MRCVFRMKYSGTTVTWEDGKITADADAAQKIEDYNEAVEKSGHGMGFTGASPVSFPSANYLKTPVGTYLLLNSMEPTEIVEGEIPEETLKALFGEDEEQEDGVVY